MTGDWPRPQRGRGVRATGFAPGRVSSCRPSWAAGALVQAALLDEEAEWVVWLVISDDRAERLASGPDLARAVRNAEEAFRTETKKWGEVLTAYARAEDPATMFARHGRRVPSEILRHPVRPDGLWDFDRATVRALVREHPDWTIAEWREAAHARAARDVAWGIDAEVVELHRAALIEEIEAAITRRDHPWRPLTPHQVREARRWREAEEDALRMQEARARQDTPAEVEAEVGGSELRMPWPNARFTLRPLLAHVMRERGPSCDVHCTVCACTEPGCDCIDVVGSGWPPGRLCFDCASGVHASLGGQCGLLDEQGHEVRW